MNRTLLPLVGFILALGTDPAAAQTCSAMTEPVAFGTYDPLSSSPTNSTGRVAVTCEALISISVSYTIRLSPGTGGSYAARSMAGPTTRLAYQLHTDSARSRIWGDGTGGTFSITDGYLLSALLPVVRNYTVYGQIAGRQNVPSGAYNDVITVTVSY